MIPDEEPWWMVRANTDNGLPAAIGDRYMADKVCHGTCPLAAERASETIEHLNKLPFRPIGYEW